MEIFFQGICRKTWFSTEKGLIQIHFCVKEITNAFVYLSFRNSFGPVQNIYLLTFSFIQQTSIGDRSWNTKGVGEEDKFPATKSSN